MLRSLRLRNVGPAAAMDFEPADRLNVVTGDNGLGKSFLLDLAWWAVTRTWAGRPIQPPLNLAAPPEVDIVFDAASKAADLSVSYDRANQSWRFPRGQPGEPGLVVYGRVDGDFAVWDSNRRFGDPQELETDIPKGLVFSREEVWNGLKLGDKPICNGLLADWVTWQQTGAWEFTALEEALRLLSPSDAELVKPGAPARVDLLDSRLIPTLKMPYGQDVPITIASAGMKRVIALAYLLVWAWREHLELSRIAGRQTVKRMLVIIDEVESHLHPKWQRVILSAIIKALDHLTHRSTTDAFRAPSIQYIVATHSPLVLASLEPLFNAETDGLFELRLEDAQQAGAPAAVVLQNPEFRRRGGAENWLVSDAFGLSSSRSVPAETVINEAAALLRDGAPSETQLVAMEAKLATVLSDMDPFWARWRAKRPEAQAQP